MSPIIGIKSPIIRNINLETSRYLGLVPISRAIASIHSLPVNGFADVGRCQTWLYASSVFPNIAVALPASGVYVNECLNFVKPIQFAFFSRSEERRVGK